MFSELKNRIGTEDPNVNLYLISKKNKIDNLNLVKVNFIEHASIELRAFFEKFLSQIENKEIVKYNYESLPGKKIHTLTLPEVVLANQTIEELEKPLRKKNLEDIKSISKNYTAYIIRYRLNDKSVYAIKKITSKNVFMPARKMMFWLKKGILELMEREDIFVMDYDVDCIILDNKIYVINSKNFEHIFNFKDLIMQIAKNSARDIESSGKVEGWKNLVKKISENSTYLRKVWSIIKNEYFKKIDMSELARINKEKDLQLPITNGRISIPSNPSNEQIKVILRALNDEYTESPTTKNFYEVDVKSEIIS